MACKNQKKRGFSPYNGKSSPYIRLNTRYSCNNGKISPYSTFGLGEENEFYIKNRGPSFF